MEYRRYAPQEEKERPLARQRDSRAPVPVSEVDVDTARSGGAGGQNVNKRDTKVVLHWNVDASTAFDDAEKELIRRYAHNRMNGEGEIVLYAQQERSQLQNKAAAMELLQTLVRDALIPEKDRIPTKPKRSAKERRLDEKSHHGRKKEDRRRVDEGDW